MLLLERMITKLTEVFLILEEVFDVVFFEGVEEDGQVLVGKVDVLFVEEFFVDCSV